MKLFDYKFLLTLGLCLIVYFLYREIEILTKRVNALEKGTPDKKVNKIELPPPPPEENKMPSMLQLILDKAKQSGPKMVEEYSNDNRDNIYSHDNLNTHTNEHDTLMVESILNMVKEDVHNAAEVSNNEQVVESSSDEELIEVIDINQETAQPVETNQEVSQPVETNQETSPPVENNQAITQQLENDSESDEIVLIKENVSNKLSLESLNKKKLDELYEIASKYDININNDAGKKKKKSDLVQEIFDKQ